MEIKTELDRTVFREYDIRGEYGNGIDESMAYTLGLAYATKIRSLGKDTCVVGHDNRLSGESLTEALMQGIKEAGVNIKYIGLVTTPEYYFACIHFKIDTGIMVTASHNPVGDNGFKIALENYDNACGEKIQELYEIAISKNFTKGSGSIETYDIKDAYIERMLKDIALPRKLKVVIDPANGTTSILVHDIFDKLNLDVVYINDTSDGSFPNHHPDPSVPENMIELQNKVRNTNADLGIGYDGDGDRLGIVDENGNIVAIDTFMAIVWNDIMTNVTNKNALFDVKCSKQLEDEIIRLGGNPIIYRTGNSYQKNRIKELDLAFGGELSGHVFFRDRWDGFDSGIYASLRLMEIVARKGTLSSLYANFNKYYSTPEIKIAVTEDTKFSIVERVKDYCQNNGVKTITIDGVRAQYPDSWALVRASNTGPNLTLRFEAKSENRLEEIKKEYLNLIEKIMNE